jgi:uncharacterized alkaline shock family protein YloU
MTTPTTPNSSANASTSSAAPPRAGGTASGAPGLASSQGSTQIAETVVSKIAGLAAREINGVYKLGGGAARAFGAIRERIPGGTTSASQGVTVEVGETQAAVDLEMAVEYGVSIVELSKAVRRNVITSLERTTGLEVVEVNVIVSDVHLPTDDDGDGGRSASDPAEQREPRVQ